MPFDVRLLEFADCQAWDEFVLRHPHGSPFHLTAWKNSIEETFGYRPFYLLASGGACVRGVLPLFLVRNFLLGKALISSPFAVYGGILADSPEAAGALRERLKRLARDLSVDYAELRNAWPEQCADNGDSGFTRVSRYVTFTQQIGPDEQAILDAIPRKTRYMVRKALRHPFFTRRAAGPSTFVDLYTRNLRRLGTPSFPAKHFAALIRNYGESLDIREVCLGDKVAAAVMTFYFRDQILPYYGASDPRYHEFAPNNFMYFDLMRWGGRHGFRIFDFGRSKKQESGSFDFKAHWGMQVRELPYEILLNKRRSLPNYSPNNPRFRLAIRVWQHLPLPVTRILGPMLLKLVP